MFRMSAKHQPLKPLARLTMLLPGHCSFHLLCCPATSDPCKNSCFFVGLLYWTALLVSYFPRSGFYVDRGFNLAGLLPHKYLLCSTCSCLHNTDCCAGLPAALRSLFFCAVQRLLRGPRHPQPTAALADCFDTIDMHTSDCLHHSSVAQRLLRGPRPPQLGRHGPPENLL